MGKTTHTYATLAVSEASFNDIRDRLIRAYDYQENSPDAEYYFVRTTWNDFQSPIEKIIFGTTALVLENGPHDET